MREPTYDRRIRATRPLVPPLLLEQELPLADDRAAFILRSRREIEAILAGADDRLLVVVGPCSIHDTVAAADYAGRLVEAARRLAGSLLIVMRVYFEKPRTVAGWKGLINDPDRDGSFQINRGLAIARKLMIDVTRMGLPVGTEFLDTTFGQYYSDLVSWAAIGARTVESQVHRELASGLSMPVGFKNRTDGNVQVAVDAILSARQPHWFPSLTREGAAVIFGTSGNPHGHLVLRGGASGPNFGAGEVAAAAGLLAKNGLPPRLMVDCSHANSGKEPDRQPAVAADLGGRIAAGERSLVAIMIESNLVGGSQDYRAKPLVYGQSVTDPCLSWEDTVPVLERLAEAVRLRRTSD